MTLPYFPIIIEWNVELINSVVIVETMALDLGKFPRKADTMLEEATAARRYNSAALSRGLRLFRRCVAANAPKYDRTKYYFEMIRLSRRVTGRF